MSKNIPKTPKKSNIPEDNTLWGLFVKDVVPLLHEEKVRLRKKHEEPSIKTHYVKRESYPVLIEPKYNFMDKEPRRIKTRRDPNKIYVDACIDLHGLSQDDAYNKLVPFLIHMQQRSAKWGLIITGKSGILFDMVPKWLDALPNLVVSYRHARPNHGGTGAIYVAVRKLKQT